MSAAGQGAAGICRAMSQMKPAISRATAVTVRCLFFPRAVSRLEEMQSEHYLAGEHLP